MAQSPCFLLPLPVPSLHPSLLLSTYLETLLAVIGSHTPWSQVTHELTSPFLNPSPFLPIPNSQYPSQISPASRAHKDDDSTPASKIRNNAQWWSCYYFLNSSYFSGKITQGTGMIENFAFFV
jgi:hypothetical protein